MHLEQIPSRFQKLSEQRELNYSLASAASGEDILRAEQRLGISIPEQVKLFYRSFNGLHVEEPQLEIRPLERLDFTSPDRLHFVTLDGDRRMLFDVSHLNEAGQWDIVTEDDYRVTFTMASFWTHKLWAWVEQKRAVWQDETAP
jgi:hypothetical protein